MSTIPIASVVIPPDRFRKDFGNIQELAASIKQHKLIHPILLKRDNTLIAGERRIIACKLLGWTEIDFMYRDEADPLTLKQLEFEENIRRKDFTDAERAEAILSLHHLMESMHGKSEAGGKGPGGSMGWTTQQTADLLGVAKSSVSVAINVAEHVKEHPEDDLVNKALKKSVYEANKILLLRKEAAVRKFLSAKADEKKIINQDQAVEVVDTMLQKGDCLDLIKTLPDSSVDFIHTDPQYGIDLASIKKDGGADIYKNDSVQALIKLWEELPTQFMRVLKPNAHIFVWCGYTNFHALEALMVKAGFDACPVPFVWVKVNSAWQCIAPAVWPASACDFALICKKGSPVLRRQGRPNFCLCPIMTSGDKTHPLERPYELLKDVLERFVSPTQVVLDTFAGSASTIKACYRLGMKGIGYEIDSDYYNSARLALIDLVRGPNK